MSQPVLHATIGHLQLEALVGGYEAAAQAHDAVEHVYDAAATLAEWRGASSVGTPVRRGMQRKWEGMGCPVRAA
jgi:hypothetical protein